MRIPPMLASTLLALGCATTEIPTTHDDPASSVARSVPPRELGAALAPDFDPLAPAPPSLAGARVAEPAVAEGAPFVCPMHPEVTSDQAGKCPKCGMKLVPKKPAKETGP